MGVDVSTEKIVSIVRDTSPDYVGLSALLTTTMLSMKDVLDELRKTGLRNNIKVLVGGAAVSQEYAREIRADAYCKDGFEAVKWLDNYRESISYITRG